MHIEIIGDHFSIKKGLNLEIPNFTVLTGPNGSGKSQLLQAMTASNLARIDGGFPQSIALMTQGTFVLDDESPQSAHNLNMSRDRGWSTWSGMQKSCKKISEYRESLGREYAEIESSLRRSRGSFVEFCRGRGVDLIKIIKEESEIGHFPQEADILQVLALAPCSPDLISEQDFLAYWRPPQHPSKALPTQLGLTMWNYYLKYIRNEIARLPAQHERYPHNICLSEDEFERIHGPKPWELMNSFIESIGGLNYRVNSPEGYDPFGSFTTRLISKSDPTVEVDFSSLSSGEKTMLSLASILYKKETKGVFPSIILLDEVDASLHPSMVKGLIRVIEDVLIPLGTQVVLVTHSPTTAALAPEKSLYQMTLAGSDRIEKIDRPAAIAMLTEGFATLDQGVTIFKEAARYRVSIITEGKNNLLLKKALVYFGLDREIGILAGVDGMTGKSQVAQLFHFFSRLPHDSHVACIFDCDEESQMKELGETSWIVIPHNPANDYVSRGIENAFHKSLFASFLTPRRNKDGQEIMRFDGRKNEFSEFICGRNNSDDFEWFKGIASQLIALLGRNN